MALQSSPDDPHKKSHRIRCDTAGTDGDGGKHIKLEEGEDESPQGCDQEGGFLKFALLLSFQNPQHLVVTMRVLGSTCLKVCPVHIL